MASLEAYEKLSWWEPAWSYRPAIRRELAPLVRGIPTILGVTAGVAILLILLCRHYVPNLQFDWLKALLGGSAGMGGILGILFVPSWFIPPRITITRQFITRTHTSSSAGGPMDKVHAACILETVPGWRVLIVQFVARDVTRERRYGLAPHVSGEALAALFGTKWNAPTLPPDAHEETRRRALRGWALAIALLYPVCFLGLLVAVIMGASRRTMEMIMWAECAAMGAAMLAACIIEAKHKRARRSAQKTAERTGSTPRLTAEGRAMECGGKR